MATTKKGGKPSPRGGGKALVPYDAELAKFAKAADATEAHVGGGGQFIKTRGGVLEFQGAEVPGNAMNVVVTDHVLENNFYGDKYDPDNPQPPICYAFGRTDKEMVPHEEAADPQADSCAECPWNKFGSADKGRGKACKNQRRLALIPEDGLGDLENAETAYLKIPVTSGKAWAGYVRSLDETM